MEHLLTESPSHSPVLLLFTHGATEDAEFSTPAITKFLTDYDTELKRLKEITRLGGTHGSRRWDEKSLTALIAKSALICGELDDVCSHKCDVLLKTVGAPVPNSPTSDSPKSSQPHIADLIDHSTCRIPSYSTLFKYLTTTTGQLSIPSTGYVSHSESLSSHHDVALSVAIGREAVRNMGVHPSPLAWQIDCFGHSATTAKILKETGVEAVVYNRANAAAKKKIGQDGGLFVWSLPDDSGPTEAKVVTAAHQASSSRESSSMNGIMLLDHYNSPATANFRPS